MELQDQIQVLVICYAMLFLLCFWAWRMKSENIVSQKVLNGNWLLLHIRHAGGVFIMTALPLLYLPVVPDGVIAWPGSVDHIKTLALIIAALILLILVVKNREELPKGKIPNKQGSPFHPVLHIVLRSFFLISYEWFFRGCILFSCIDLFGMTTAIIINVALYALIHSFNGRKEMYGSVPFGLMLCAFTIWYQSVWPSILLHLLISSSHESYFLSTFLCNKSKPVL